MSSPDVIVVGAGIAGLSAAVHLANRGARVLVLEARPALGGRATAFTDPQTGERVDNGQHVLMGCFRETLRLLELVGTRDRVRLQGSLDVEFVDLAGRRSRFRCPALPPPLNLAAGLFEWDALSWADRAAALRMAGPIRTAIRQARGETQALAASPGETVEEWLMHNGQTSRLREMLWEPLARAALNQSIREAAAPPFARVLAEMYGEDSRDAALGLPACPLDELYAEPAGRYLQARGCEIRTMAQGRIRIDSARVTHVESKGERLHAGAVVCAVPWFALGDAFDGDVDPLRPLLHAADKTTASPIVSVNLWLDRRVLNSPFLGLPGRTMRWVFDKGQMFDAGASHLTLIASGATELMAVENAALVAMALDQLRAAVPEVRQARVIRTSVVRERRATFSLAPGQPPRPGSRTPVDRLVLAGDWIDTGLPATIESAAVSGRKAAEVLA
jgi:zeta-carotene desaturase